MADEPLDKVQDGLALTQQRTVDDKISRLRTRLKRIKEDGGVGDIVGVLLGILDLLDDEL